MIIDLKPIPLDFLLEEFYKYTINTYNLYVLDSIAGSTEDFNNVPYFKYSSHRIYKICITNIDKTTNYWINPNRGFPVPGQSAHDFDAYIFKFDFLDTCSHSSVTLYSNTYGINNLWFLRGFL